MISHGSTGRSRAMQGHAGGNYTSPLNGWPGVDAVVVSTDKTLT